MSTPLSQSRRRRGGARERTRTPHRSWRRPEEHAPPEPAIPPVGSAGPYWPAPTGPADFIARDLGRWRRVSYWWLFTPAELESILSI